MRDISEQSLHGFGKQQYVNATRLFSFAVVFACSFGRSAFKVLALVLVLGLRAGALVLWRRKRNEKWAQ